MTYQDFEQKARQLRPLLLHVGQQFFGDTDSAEDVAQETLMRLWLLRDRIDATVGLEPLAVRMAKNVCVSEWRRRQVRQSVTQHAELPSQEFPHRTLEFREEVERLRQAVARLKPAEQRLFRMRHELEMDIPQISAVTGIGTRSVSAMLSTAKRTLTELLYKKGV